MKGSCVHLSFFMKGSCAINSPVSVFPSNALSWKEEFDSKDLDEAEFEQALELLVEDHSNLLGFSPFLSQLCTLISRGKPFAQCHCTIVAQDNQYI